MFDTNSFADRIFSLKKGDAAAFEALAMEAFRYQSAENDVYGRFIKALGVDAASVDSIHKIPFLPISLFKSMKVVTGGFIPQEVFTSSGTTGMAQSRHYVKSLELYRRSFFTSWELHYGRWKITPYWLLFAILSGTRRLVADSYGRRFHKTQPPPGKRFLPVPARRAARQT